MRTLALLAVAAFTLTQAHADWPRLRGPKGDGIAEGSKAPLKWSEKENIAWKLKLPGPGSSSPIVVGDKVFVTCWSGYADGTGDDMSKLLRHLVCVSKADGNILWDKTVPGVSNEDQANGMLMEHGYASSTPVSDGQSVFVFFGKAGALAFDLDGKQLWHTPLGSGGNSRQWGSASSPVLYKDTVIISAFDEGGAIVGLDKKSGKEVWRAPAEGLQLVYSTPLVSGEDLLLPVPGELWGLNPDNGKLRWYATYNMGGNVSPCISVSDGIAYVTGGYPTQGSAAIKLGGKGDVTKTNTVWSINSASYIPSPVLHEGHLYVINDAGFAMCLEAKTGNEIYRERVMENAGGGRRGGGKPFYASPVLVDGRLYCPSRKNGTFVLAAKPTYELLSKNVIADDSSQFNSSAAVDGNKLFLRSDQALYCIGE